MKSVKKPLFSKAFLIDIIADNYFGSNRNLLLEILLNLDIIADNYFGSNRNYNKKRNNHGKIIADNYFGSNRNGFAVLVLAVWIIADINPLIQFFTFSVKNDDQFTHDGDESDHFLFTVFNQFFIEAFHFFISFNCG